MLKEPGVWITWMDVAKARRVNGGNEDGFTGSSIFPNSFCGSWETGDARRQKQGNVETEYITKC